MVREREREREREIRERTLKGTRPNWICVTRTARAKTFDGLLLSLACGVRAQFHFESAGTDLSCQHFLLLSSLTFFLFSKRSKGERATALVVTGVLKITRWWTLLSREYIRGAQTPNLRLCCCCLAPGVVYYSLLCCLLPTFSLRHLFFLYFLLLATRWWMEELAKGRNEIILVLTCRRAQETDSSAPIRHLGTGRSALKQLTLPTVSGDFFFSFSSPYIWW